VSFSLNEFETALDAVRNAGSKLLAQMAERILQVPQVFAHLALLDGGTLRNLVGGELGLTK